MQLKEITAKRDEANDVQSQIVHHGPGIYCVGAQAGQQIILSGRLAARRAMIVFDWMGHGHGQTVQTWPSIFLCNRHMQQNVGNAA
jgi:hypothetical protein